MDKIKISLIICTHNPNLDYITKVINSLKSQNFPIENWELILIDNASTNNVIDKADFSWHPNSRVVREEKLGLTSARLKGIDEANSELLIFVDDDNVLYKDYLGTALNISKNYPYLGAWGGQIIPEFELKPPEWTQPYRRALAIHEFKEDKWSNLVNQYETTPCGAGLCIRRNICLKYVDLLKNDSLRSLMGRRGNNLTSYEDSDMAFTACDMGYGIGLFVNLKLKHLIPKERLREEYIINLLESSAYSGIIVESFRGKLPILNRSWQSRIADLYRFFRMSPREKQFYKARQIGMNKAIKEIQN